MLLGRLRAARQSQKEPTWREHQTTIRNARSATARKRPRRLKSWRPRLPRANVRSRKPRLRPKRRINGIRPANAGRASIQIVSPNRELISGWRLVADEDIHFPRRG